MPKIGSENGVWGKPVGVISDADGSIYVTSDWYTHLIIKVTHENRSTAVLEEQTSEEPTDLGLAQNYPNPFNAETSIPFPVSRGGGVTLDVYTLAGQKISTLIDGHRSSGTYVARWDGTNDAGEALGTGIYVYQLKTSEDAALTRKLLLVR